MTFDEIQDECIALRFKESQRTSIKRWINLRYHFLWALADWPWKRVGPADLTITASDATPALPSGFDRPLFIYDNLGQRVLWMEPDEFDELYLYGELNSTRGRPQAFKWVNSTITLGEIPDANYTYKIVYERGMTYLASGSAETVGAMTSASDTPIWDEQFHYVLVFGAIASGLRLENDPTYQQMEEEFSTMTQAMKDHYLPTLAASGPMQYGRDQLGITL